ncbi:hypothetical protein M2282_002824 [Variovorax boronicumulans]|uniref:tetratricopeptide repeat protein n=1 Tax=Variovorax boronicumulans TaxID=436515 RepID=UPI002475B3B4|nr:hypothetical protein [Variovorax boronicumulans]MDH6167674.1 hypothetical protein [Variovorax boronicumulans]
MSITRHLTVSILMFGAMHAHASSDGTDSHCVIGKNRTLFNQCDYPVDVGFCVENPQQTKNFFDSSDAFKCPGGGLSTLQAGKEEGNILNGTVHWFACSTAHRGSAGWKYVPGSGYKGHCARDEAIAGSGSPTAERGLVRPAEPAVWGAATECIDWFPEGPSWWRELDPTTNKLMCKMPLSPSARTATVQRYIASRREEAEAAQGKRDEAARADQQFRTGLQTMNAGQLFARADELSSQGDRARAREVQRALISRFPDHPLAATAARQMAGESGGNSNPSAGGSSMPAGAAVSGGRLSSQACEAMKQSVIATRVPANASITASNETVMFMTRTALNMIAGNCPTEPGVTPAQIEAERRQRQQQYTAAESACNAVQSGDRRCGPRNHFGPGAL